MSGNSSKNEGIISPESLIAVQDILLEHILSRQWEDYEDFARELSERILSEYPNREKDLLNCIKGFSHPFYSFNNLSKERFLIRFPIKKMLKRLSTLSKQEKIGSENGNINS